LAAVGVDGAIKTIADLKGRVLATDPFGSAIDIAKFRVVTYPLLKQSGLR